MKCLFWLVLLAGPLAQAGEVQVWVRSKPPCAEISVGQTKLVDGQLQPAELKVVGKTNCMLSLVPGDYLMSFKLDDYEEARIALKVVDGGLMKPDTVMLKSTKAEAPKPEAKADPKKAPEPAAPKGVRPQVAAAMPTAAELAAIGTARKNGDDAGQRGGAISRRLQADMNTWTPEEYELVRGGLAKLKDVSDRSAYVYNREGNYVVGQESLAEEYVARSKDADEFAARYKATGLPITPMRGYRTPRIRVHQWLKDNNKLLDVPACIAFVQRVQACGINSPELAEYLKDLQNPNGPPPEKTDAPAKTGKSKK